MKVCTVDLKYKVKFIDVKFEEDLTRFIMVL